MNIDAILKKMSLRDKIALCSGADFWHTKAMPEYGIPGVMMADGPHGLRKQEDASDMLGVNPSVPATCFPAAVSSACSWDTELLFDIGAAIAGEASANGVGVVLGPGANIKRNPLCGRNFEYFSEDPLLTGKLAAAYIRGAEATGVGTSLKHFACNNQEYKRFSSDSIMDERTLREIYLAGFEIAVREGRPLTVMCAYNKINGTYCSSSKALLTDILRKEWGFDGAVITDWGAMHDRSEAFAAGCDLSMPGDSAYGEPEACQAVQAGTLDEADIDRSAQRILRMVFQTASEHEPADMESHHALARRAAEESAVLLKNDGGLLPLAGYDGVVFIGHMARIIRFQGTGSSFINPWRLVSAADACPEIPFAAGCTADGGTTDALLAEAIAAAKGASAAVVFAGLPEACESEGFDRENMRMPDGHNRLIEAVAGANPNTVVVLLCGSPVETPWADRVKAILYMGLPGQAGGEAIINLLFGRAVPCGKLAESWPCRYADCVSAEYYAGQHKDAHYREGIYVGYRYYHKAKVPVRWPFGHGLSYTSFVYSDLRADADAVSCQITNTGTRPGKEIAQLYIAPPEGMAYRPARELKAFAKVHLRPGESRIITLPLDDRSFSIWQDGWKTPGGEYTVHVGGSSENLTLSASIEVPGDAPPDVSPTPVWYIAPSGAPEKEEWVQLLGHPVTEKPARKGSFTMENSVMEMMDQSLIMKLMYKGIEATIARGFDGKKDYSNPKFRMMIASAADSSLSGMRISGGMRSYVMEGLLAMANGHVLKGLRLMMKR